MSVVLLKLKKGDEVIGGRIRVKVVKNKVAAPFRQAEFDLLYREGISPEGELLAIGEKYNLIKKSGAAYSYTPNGKATHEVKLGRGYDAARQFLRENSDLKQEILQKIKEKLLNNDEDSSNEEADANDEE